MFNYSKKLEYIKKEIVFKEDSYDYEIVKKEDKKYINELIKELNDEYCNIIGLKLFCPYMSKEKLKNYFDDFYDTLNNNQTLSSLLLFSFHHDFNFEKLAQSLKNNTSITKLKIINTFLKDLSPLSDLLKNNTVLTSLDLTNNTIRDLKPLIEVLKSNNTLTELNLSQSFELCDGDYIKLYEVLKTNTTLTKLDLSNNRINDLSLLGEALKNNNTLTSINLNNIYGFFGINSIEEALKTNTTLTELKLNGLNKNEISNYYYKGLFSL